MCIGNRRNKSTALIPVASMCLVVGLLWPYLFHPATLLGKDLSDGLRGLLFGASIGINVMAIRLGRRQGRCGGSIAAHEGGLPDSETRT
ncbi:MAG: hypothetical protein WA254_23030 [Candidatus Sulfotelmatobacter sp.]